MISIHIHTYLFCILYKIRQIVMDIVFQKEKELPTKNLCILVPAPLFLILYLIYTNFLQYDMPLFGAVWEEFAFYLEQI